VRGLVPALLGILCWVGFGPAALSADPPADRAQWCARSRNGELEIADLADSGSTACEGEVFVVGDGIWGHAADSTGSPIPTEPAGTVELTLKSTSVEERPLPAAFVGQVLRGIDSDVHTDRVLCLKVAEGEAVTEMAYACAAPAGTSAVKIPLDGFGTTFVWDLSVTEGETVRANARLFPAVRLSGRVETPGLTMRLSPRGLERSRRSVAFASVVRELPEGGAFVVEDVAPGAYVYRLESSSGASSEAEVVVPTSVSQMELPRLREPVRVDVQVQVVPQAPQAGGDGSDGNGWELTLVPRSDSDRAGAPLSQRTDALGWATFESVDPGPYLVLVEDGAGSLWLTHELTVEKSDVVLLELEHVPIRGRASIGDEPFEGELIFGTTQGSRRITVSTDRHGRFKGLLPSEGLWEVEVSLEELGCGHCEGTPGTIRVPPVEVKKGPSGAALFDVKVPDTRLRGRVVREELLPSGGSVQRPQEGALILVTRAVGPVQSRGRQAQVWTDETGRFEIRGIEPGQVQVGAVLQEPPCESAWQTVSLESGADPRPIELVLEEKSPMTVRVTAAGQPVGGAWVTALVDGGLSKRGATGPGGLLSLELASRRSGTLVVVAPGYGVVLQGFDAVGPERAVMEVSVPLVPAAGALALTELRADTFDRGWLSSDRHGVVPLRLLPSLLSGGVSFGEAITVPGLSPGSYEFCLGERPCWSATVFADALTEIDLSKE